MNEPLQFLNTYCDFSDPNWVWVLTGLSRNKDNGNPLCHDYLERLVITCPDDILTCYNRVHQDASDPNTTYRMYISLNARDAVKTTFHFQKTLLDIGYGLANGQDDALQKAKKIGSLWKSELQQSHSRATKRILLDIDTSDVPMQATVQFCAEKLGVMVHAVRPTVSGLHIVIDACDTRGLMAGCKQQGIPVDLQRDSMVFVEKWKKE
jgi:hypothetical protein